MEHVVSHPPAIDPSSRFEGLFALATGLFAAESLQELLELGMNSALSALKAARVMIAFRAETGPATDTPVTQVVQRYRSTLDAAGEADQHKQHAFSVTMQVLESGLGIAGCEDEAEFWVCLPLVDANLPFGAIYVARHAENYTAAEELLLHDLAELLGQAVANAERGRRTDDRLQQFERLNRVFMTISQDLELDRVQDMVLRMTMELTKAERAFVLLYEDAKLRMTSGRDRDGELSPESAIGLSQTACQRVLDTNQGIFVFNTGDHKELALSHSVLNLQLKSILVVPLSGKSGLVGLLYVDSRSEMPAAIEQDLAVLSAIANQATILIENSLLLRQATMDGLTGLLIRSYFMNRLAEETRRTLRYGGFYSLLVLDLDNFKRLNDTYGHTTGDAALRMVSHELMSRLRNGIDLCGRYGGEEIVIMLPATDTEGAMIVAERLRKGIEQAMIQGPAGEMIQVTTSIGIATLPSMARTAADVFALADKALYTSKRAGRNRTTIYTPEVE
jgi:diguanylate cyclase (GGDEF)-like protein